MTRKEIVSCARSYLGTPFHHAGRVKGVGVDCAGLVICVAHELGYTGPDLMAYTEYSQAPDGHTLRRLLREALRPKSLTKPLLPGDVLLMRFAREPQHVALVTDLGIVHAYTGVGRVVEHRLDEVWQRRIVAAFAFKGIERRRGRS
jgi:cell wall-associated NlpC family hydrolase